ncbi:MAG: DUF3800 domain-containing protein [Gammaproteobacteria bacterium]|nr:DUF3800 domain-containing protein [Gammaproteobacteria bacterium]
MVSEAVIFLDESGDLGWKFGSPYRRGGSSRYLTIATVIIPDSKRYLLPRLIKKLYIKYKWDPKIEKKWARMTAEERKHFSILAQELISEHNDLHYCSITVYKPKVAQHIREDSNKLYNYMIGLLLIDTMSNYGIVRFIPDYREIKVASGNSLHDYLVSKLWFEKQVSTQVINQPKDSASDKGVQFADMLSGLIQHHFEDNNDELFPAIEPYICIKRLYFP